MKPNISGFPHENPNTHYFMVAEGQCITGFLNIPPEREYTYAPSRKAGKA